MNFFVLTGKTSDAGEFIKFWRQFYTYSNEEKYNDSIGLTNFDKQNLIALFEWKNGSRLSDRKTKSFEEKILSKLEIINTFKKSQDFKLDEFAREFKGVSAIWKSFLLHIIKPKEYPVFDQHVYRAYYYLKNSLIKELPQENIKKEKIYFEEYLAFFQQIQDGFSLKETDEALWSFGKFLKSNYGRSIK